MPDEVEFATKTALAQHMLAVPRMPVPTRWVAADEAYGKDFKFRSC